MHQSHKLNIHNLAQNVLAGKPISRTDALGLLHLSGPDRYELFYWANQIRIQYVGNAISLCAIASIRTGRCSEDCCFCAQSAHYNTHVEPAVATETDVIAAAKSAAENGAENFGLVASGQKLDDPYIDYVDQLAKKIKTNADISVCAALGCLTEEQAKRLYQIGVRRYNHNLETSKRFFEQIVTTHTWDDRAETVRAAKKAGMKVCCGGIIGMGETLEDRVDLAMALRDLEVDTININCLNPVLGTPLQDAEPMMPLEALQAVAMFRFVAPKADIKIAGGRERGLRELQSWSFFAGASSLMIGNYLTTLGRSPAVDLQMLKDLGLPIR